MYHTTGLTIEQITDLCTLVDMDTAGTQRNWPPSLGLFKSAVIALTYMRRNRVQVKLAETYEVSQSTISRAVTRMTRLIEGVLKKFVPTADELDDQTQYIVDGTLLQCWS
ncbi:transposase family protein [Amycolatopsis sp. H20-H5]|uniref:transposase family protein n=1 Tax=Amycolatopsis sp. H20-H5 TaxID=3046309 RepID=UPI002DB59005|nr:transposase family protein [Amycolatopsis sp. H20-H5]MEC3977713.1 transposase family protein [Amycolatopsis sp. H20-H5]